jgi:hypothetical protein
MVDGGFERGVFIAAVCRRPQREQEEVSGMASQGAGGGGASGEREAVSESASFTHCITRCAVAFPRTVKRSISQHGHNWCS